MTPNTPTPSERAVSPMNTLTTLAAELRAEAAVLYADYLATGSIRAHAECSTKHNAADRLDALAREMEAYEPDALYSEIGRGVFDGRVLYVLASPPPA